MAGQKIKTGIQDIIKIQVLINRPVMDGKRVIDMSAPDIEKPRAGVQLFPDGKILTLGRSGQKWRIISCPGVMRPRYRNS